MANLFQVIEWYDSTGQEMVHRLPESGSGEYKLGDQLRVQESQVAVIFRDGKAKLAPFKYPRWIEFRSELPKTATGKIQRFKLRAEGQS